MRSVVEWDYELKQIRHEYDLVNKRFKCYQMGYITLSIDGDKETKHIFTGRLPIVEDDYNE